MVRPDAVFEKKKCGHLVARQFFAVLHYRNKQSTCLPLCTGRGDKGTLRAWDREEVAAGITPTFLIPEMVGGALRAPLTLSRPLLCIARCDSCTKLGL